MARDFYKKIRFFEVGKTKAFVLLKGTEDKKTAEGKMPTAAKGRVNALEVNALLLFQQRKY